MTLRMSPDHPNYRLLLRELESGPGTIHDLAAALGLSLKCAYRVVNAARKQRQVRIVDWERARGGRPVYGLGQGKDAPRPVPLGHAEQMRRLRARRKWFEGRAAAA